MNRPIHVLSVVGARPQFVKASAIARATERAKLEHSLVHTGQHYDPGMSQVFFDELALPEPDFHLGVGSASHGVQTGRMLEALEPVVEELAPDIVLVYGDTNSTLAGALVSAKLNVRAAHVEAGMRSGRRDMPEEINRIVADHVCEVLLCSTESAVRNLEREGLSDRVALTGDVMHEVLLEHVKHRPASAEGRDYALATVHRAANTDDPERLATVVAALEKVGSAMPVVFPIHPRTRAALGPRTIAPSVEVIDPLGYGEMLDLEGSARVIITDSGGVQKEALWLRVPCVTLREETEWPETLEGGWNVLAGVDPDAVFRAATRERPNTEPTGALDISDAADRIVETIRTRIGR